MTYAMVWGIKYGPKERLYVLWSTKNVDISTQQAKLQDIALTWRIA
jgi:hypothetical protein